MKGAKAKRIVVISDLHCGHIAGLTPPKWQTLAIPDKRLRFAEEMWDWYKAEINALKPIDSLFVVGDSIDGKGERSGGTEQITTDRVAQADIAEACLREAEAKNIRMVFGTPYHTGADEDWEMIVAERLGAHICGHDFAEVGGVTLDMKHFIGGSQIPHGRYTAIARDMLWNLLWSSDDRQPKADIVVRAHVHYHVSVQDHGLGRIGIILPGMQGYGSKFGIRRCSGRIDIGFIHFDIGSDGRRSWESHLFGGDILKIKPDRIG